MQSMGNMAYYSTNSAVIGFTPWIKQVSAQNLLDDFVT